MNLMRLIFLFSLSMLWTAGCNKSAGVKDEQGDPETVELLKKLKLFSCLCKTLMNTIFIERSVISRFPMLSHRIIMHRCI
jgi:hypothetical protein